VRPPLTVSAVLGDAWDVYRLLFKRAFPIALAIYAVIELLGPLGDWIGNDWLSIVVALVGIALGLAGPLLVQGALVKIVRDVHEAKRPESARELLTAASKRIASLFGASLLYGFGVVIGLLLLVVPGLLAAARWSLMAPAIMLEGRYTVEAQTRSRAIVRGEIGNGLGDRTWFAFGVVFVSFLLTGVLAGIAEAVVHTRAGGVTEWIATVLVGGLTAPYTAHVLSVLYYRLVEPERPAIDPQVRTWTSVWRGEMEAT
jgi:hypothetical protein